MLKRNYMEVTTIRSRAYWALILSAIILVTCGIGVFQFLMSGVVSIRPDHKAVSGIDAVHMLLLLGFMGAFFAAYGIYLLKRAGILSNKKSI